MRRILQTAGTALLCVFVLGFAKVDIESNDVVVFEREMRQVKQLQRDGQITNAVAVCNKIIAAASTRERRETALLQRALLRIGLKDYQGALADVSIVQTNRSNVVWVYHLRGEAYLGQQRYPEALRVLSRALELDPIRPGVLADRGMTYHELGYSDLADADLSAAIKVAPDGALFYWRRGFFRFQRGDYKSSAEDLSRAIKLDPEPAAGYREYGVAQYFLGDYDAATNSFSKFAESAKTEALHHVSLASCYSMVNDYPRAMEHCQRAVELDSKCALCYFNRAVFSFFEGHFESAYSDVSTAIELNPSDSDSFGVRGAIHLARGSYEAAYEDFKSQITLSPEAEDGYTGYSGLVASRILSGRANEAVAELWRASGKRFWRPEFWVWCRLLGVETGKDWDEDLLQFSPRSWPHVLIRYCLGQVGTEEVLKCAAHPNPTIARHQLAEAHFYIAALLAQKGNSNGAKREFAEAVKADQIKWPVSVLAQKQLETNWFATLRKAKGPTPQ